MTAISHPQPLRLPRSARLRPGAVAQTLRECAIAMAIVWLAASFAFAEAPGQPWVPEALAMPDDAETVSEHAVGSTMRMFSIATHQDVEALLDRWEEALRAQGYVIEAGKEELLERSIEFSGHGIGNAKIVAAPTGEGGRTVVSFDATLD